MSGAPASSDGAASSGAAPPAVAKAKPPDGKVKLVFPPKCTPEWAHALVPATKGAGIAFDDSRHFRWSGQYLGRPAGQEHFTKAFGRHGDEQAIRSCLVAALKWIWEVHRECTGEECPHDFDSKG